MLKRRQFIKSTAIGIGALALPALGREKAFSYTAWKRAHPDWGNQFSKPYGIAAIKIDERGVTLITNEQFFAHA